MLGLARFLHYNNTEINNLFLLPLKCCGFTREESSMFSKAARRQNMQTGNFFVQLLFTVAKLPQGRT